MSGLEVISSISAVISLLDALKKIYNGAQNEIKSSAAFEVVGRRLPVILHILQTCKDSLEPHKVSVLPDVCEALKQILDACGEKAQKLRETFEKVILGEPDTWEKRYADIIRRLGKENKVEDLMFRLTQDARLIINNIAVRSATPEQNGELEDFLNEMKFVESSNPAEQHSTSTFHSDGGAQTNNLNSGSGQQINDKAHVETPIFHFEPLRPAEDFSFRGPVGIRLGQAPYVAPELFVGRDDELNAIAEILNSDHDRQEQRRIVLGGMGGIGKTQLAIAYAESPRDSYTSVLWLNAASEVALKDSFRLIASLIFDIQDTRVLEDKEVVRHIHQWLSDPNNSRWLLIFDNYDDPDHFEINPYYPPASHGSIMITTRRPDLVAGSIVHIKPFKDIEDSLMVLRARSRRENALSDPYAKQLAERVGGLPLALVIAGTYLHQSDFTFERYLQEYEQRWNVDPRPTNLQKYQERKLYTAWDILFSRLQREDPDAAKLLKLFAYFGNQRLWYKHYRRLSTDSPEWGLRDVLIDDINLNGAMEIQTQYYFMDLHQMLESWSMHDCVHDWTLALLNKDIDPEHCRDVFDCIDASISGVAKSLQDVSYSRSAEHATRLVHQRFIQRNIISISTPRQLEEVSHALKLLQGQIQRVAAEQMSIQLLAAMEKALGPDHASTLRIVDSLGGIYCEQGRFNEAEQMYVRALAGREKVLGPTCFPTLETVNSLGLLYVAQAKLNEAEQMFMRVLARREKEKGPDETMTLDAVEHLGMVYFVQGKLDKAEQTYMRALAGNEKALGPDNISTLNTVVNLGNVYRAHGNLDQAEQMSERALAGGENALALKNYRATLTSVNNIGMLCRDNGKLDETEIMLIRLLAGREMGLGLDHTSTLESVHNLGMIYRDQGRLDEAEHMLMRALAGRERMLGPDHALTLETVQNLGILRQDQGKLDEAEQILMQALSGRKEVLGPDHESTLGTVYDLEIVYREQGKLI